MSVAADPMSPHVMNTYGRLPIALARGEGCRVWDTTGREYLDALGGIAVNTLGHAHPKLVPALQEQIATLIHTSNYYNVTGQEVLAKKLTELSGMSNAFFCNSGLEANEAAIKLARKFGHDKGIENPQIVVYEHAFHGRSLATLSAGGNYKIQKGFGPLVDGFIRVPLNDIETLKKVTQGNPNVVAVMFETIQGEGGIHPMRAEYLQQVRALCDQQDWLMMIDEVQCGIGRTGKWFAFQWAGIQPDVVQLAKGLGSGVPIGAVIAGPKAAGVFQPGNHGTTFGGNPLAMRAGIETLAIMEADGLLQHTGEIGTYLMSKLRDAFANQAGVVDVRGQGLMVGVELAKPCGVLLQRFMEAGLLVSITADTVVRILPPLIITHAEVDELVDKLAPIVNAFLSE